MKQVRVNTNGAVLSASFVLFFFFLPLVCITYLFTACFTNTYTHTTYLISRCCEEPPLSLTEKICGFQLSADDLRQRPLPTLHPKDTAY